MILLLTAGYIFQIVSLAQNLPHEDDMFQCTHPGVAQECINDFNVRVETFDPVKLCAEDSELNQLFHSLKILKQGRFDSVAHSTFIRNWVSPSEYYNWLARRIYQVRRADDMPFATAYNTNGYVTLQSGWSRLSTLGKVGVLIHEARHTEGYGHTFCAKGPYKNTSMPGCDTSLEEGGAHGVEMEYYARVVLQGENFHPVYKSMARLMLLARSNFVFNDSSLTSYPGIYLMGKKGESYLFSEKGLTHRNSLKNYSDWTLKTSSAGPVLLKGNHAAYSVDIYNSVIQPHVDQFSYFKLMNGSRPEAQIRDFEEYDFKGKRNIFAIGDSGHLYHLDFRDINWENVEQHYKFVTFKRRLQTGRSGLFVLNQFGSVFEWNFKARQLIDLKLQWPKNVVSFALQGDTVYGLNHSGQLFDAASGTIVLGIEPMAQMVEVPVYNENMGGVF